MSIYKRAAEKGAALFGEKGDETVSAFLTIWGANPPLTCTTRGFRMTLSEFTQALGWFQFSDASAWIATGKPKLQRDALT